MCICRSAFFFFPGYLSFHHPYLVHVCICAWPAWMCVCIWGRPRKGFTAVVDTLWVFSWQGLPQSACQPILWYMVAGKGHNQTLLRTMRYIPCAFWLRWCQCCISTQLLREKCPLVYGPGQWSWGCDLLVSRNQELLSSCNNLVISGNISEPSDLAY